MNKEDILKAIKTARENSKKRKFTQTFDLIINLKDLDLKKPENNVNLFFALPFGKGKKNKICALIGKESKSKAEGVCDEVVVKEQFNSLDKKELGRLASEYDFFIAQADLMPAIAGAFGKVLGPKGKMPNPKAGCIFPPGADVKEMVDRLNKTIKLQTKNEMIVKAAVGIESMKDEEISENITAVYNYLIHSLPQEKNNVKSLLLKLTMGKPLKIGEKISEEGAGKKTALKKKKRVNKKPKVENKEEENNPFKKSVNGKEPFLEKASPKTVDNKEENKVEEDV